jgi:hypothetical protein
MIQSGKNYAHGQPPFLDEPVGDHHGYGNNMGARAADAQKQSKNIKLHESPALGKKGKTYGHQRGADSHDDTDIITLQEFAHHGSHNHHGESCNGEIERKATPGKTEGFGDGFDENPHGIHDNAYTGKVEEKSAGYDPPTIENFLIGIHAHTPFTDIIPYIFIRGSIYLYRFNIQNLKLSNLFIKDRLSLDIAIINQV